jgi:hypothetical protein
MRPEATAVPLAERLALHIAQLDARRLARAGAALAEARQQCEAFMAVEANRGSARVPKRPVVGPC